MIIRQLTERDYEAYWALFEEAYFEYLGTLKHTDPPRYSGTARKKRGNTCALRLLS